MLNYITEILTNVAIFGVLAIGLDIQWGWGGLLNLMYFTFVAAGAYAYALVTLPHPTRASGEHYLLGLHWPFLAGVFVAIIAAALLGLILGSVGLKRLRPEYFPITTLSVGLVIYQLVSQELGFANGQVGLYAIPGPFSSAGIVANRYYPQIFLGVCLVFLVAALLLAARLHSSPYGRVMRATRDAPSAAAALGYSPFRVQLSSFVLGCGIAGAGGVLLAAHLTAFNPGAWTPSETFLIYVAVLVGGKGRPLGVLLGTVLLTGVLQELTRYLPAIPGHPDAVAAIRMLIIGIVILVALRWRPQGLLPEKRDTDRQGPASSDTHAATTPAVAAGALSTPSATVPTTGGRDA